MALKQKTADGILEYEPIAPQTDTRLGESLKHRVVTGSELSARPAQAS